MKEKTNSIDLALSNKYFEVITEFIEVIMNLRYLMKKLRFYSIK